MSILYTILYILLYLLLIVLGLCLILALILGYILLFKSDWVKKLMDNFIQGTYITKPLINIISEIPLARFFFGFDKFNEGQQILDKAYSKYSKEVDSYNREGSLLEKSLNNNIKEIVRCKKKIVDFYLPSYKKKIERFKNLPVATDFFVDIRKVFESETISTNSYFESNNIANDIFSLTSFTLKGLLTLGFSSRKNANDYLSKAKDECKRKDVEIEQMKAELSKLRLIDESFLTICDVYQFIDQLFPRLLNMLDNTYSMMVYRTMVSSKSVVDTKFNLRELPKSQINEMYTIISTANIANDIVKTKLSDCTKIGQENELQKISQDISQNKNKIENLWKY